jgi:broad specificity phosphatase PhoE
MPDSTIMIIRHAEKPHQSIKGIDEAGAEDEESLTPRGWARAGALACLFAPRGSMKVGALPAPDRIYASARQHHDKADGQRIGSHSERPTQTISMVAQKLRLAPINKFTMGQEAQLAAEVSVAGKVSLVSWQHEKIVEIATAIMGQAGGGVPTEWPDDRFDLVWIFEKTGGAKSWRFRQVCQELLPGDDSNPI